MCWRADAKNPDDGRKVRHGLVRELAAAAEGPIADAEVVIGELLSNIARYTPGPFCAEIVWDAEQPSVVFHDAGDGSAIDLARPQPADLAQHGRGFALIRSLGGHVEVRRVPEHGCRVAVRLPLRRRRGVCPGAMACPEGPAGGRDGLCRRPTRLLREGRTQSFQAP